MKIKIAHVVNAAMMAGAQRVSVDILAGLPDTKYEKYLIAGEANESNRKMFEKSLSGLGINFHYLSCLQRKIGFSDLEAFWRLYKEFKSKRFDVVHTNSTKPGIVARIAAKIAGVPIVIHTVHGTAYHKEQSWLPRIIFYTIEMFASFFGDQIVCVNKYYVKNYTWLFSNKTVCTIYNGIGIADNASSKNCQPHIFRVLFVGRLDKSKDPLTLLKAVRLLKERMQITAGSFYLDVVGDGVLYQSCQSYIEKNQLTEIINMHGWHNDLTRFYARADVLCVPSVFEAFGLVFVEAACWHIPSISSNVEGIPEVVKNCESGILIDAKNYEMLAESIISLMANTEYRNALGHNAWLNANRYFSLERMQKEYAALYEGLLRDKGYAV